MFSLIATVSCALAADPPAGPPADPAPPAEETPLSEPAPAPPPVPPPVAINPWQSGPDLAPRAPLDDHFEVALEAGLLVNADPTFDLFASADAISSLGVRAGVRPLDRVEIFADWQRDKVGTSVGVDETSAGLAFGFASNQLRLGGKVDTNVISDWFRPYAAVDALAFQGTARFDDDPSDPESPGQAVRSGVAPGGELLVGFQALTAPSRDVDLGLELHLEGGYALVGPLSLGDVGSMQPGGFTMRGGVGAVF